MCHRRHPPFLLLLCLHVSPLQCKTSSSQTHTAGKRRRGMQGADELRRGEQKRTARGQRRRGEHRLCPPLLVRPRGQQRPHRQRTVRGAEWNQRRAAERKDGICSAAAELRQRTRTAPTCLPPCTTEPTVSVASPCAAGSPLKSAPLSSRLD